MDLIHVETIEGWVPLARYCEVTGESRTLVHVRISNGTWQRGKHLSTPDGGCAWVHLPSILEWILDGKKQPLRVEGAVTIDCRAKPQAEQTE